MWNDFASIGCRLVVAAAVVLPGVSHAAERIVPPVSAWNAIHVPNRWESSIQAFEKQDQQRLFAPGGNLFVGSSSIRFWKLDEAFPDQPCLNRGFGGSHLADSVYYFDRIVAKYQPAVIFLYAGDNDLAAGKSPEEVRDDYVAFAAKVRETLPRTKLVYVPVKPSLKRWSIREKGLQTNRLIREAQADKPLESSLDLWEPMLGADGKPRPELFVKDGLHLSPEGYAIWNEAVRPLLIKKQ